MLINGNTEYRNETKRALEPENIPDVKYLDTLKSPRILNTHVPFRWLPKKHIENGGKIVHVMRNPKDVYVSLYHYIKKAVALEWGSNMEKLTWDQFFDIFIVGDSPSKYFY